VIADSTTTSCMVR